MTASDFTDPAIRRHFARRDPVIDLLQETYKIHPSTGETLDQLQARYATAWRNRHRRRARRGQQMDGGAVFERLGHDSAAVSGDLPACLWTAVNARR